MSLSRVGNTAGLQWWGFLSLVSLLLGDCYFPSELILPLTLTQTCSLNLPYNTSSPSLSSAFWSWSYFKKSIEGMDGKYGEHDTRHTHPDDWPTSTKESRERRLGPVWDGRGYIISVANELTLTSYGMGHVIAITIPILAISYHNHHPPAPLLYNSRHALEMEFIHGDAIDLVPS